MEESFPSLLTPQAFPKGGIPLKAAATCIDNALPHSAWPLYLVGAIRTDLKMSFGIHISH